MGSKCHAVQVPTPSVWIPFFSLYVSSIINSILSLPFKHNLLQREGRGSRIPRPSGRGGSEPSPGFHAILRLINKGYHAIERKYAIILNVSGIRLTWGARPEAYPIPLGWGGRAQFDFYICYSFNPHPQEDRSKCHHFPAIDLKF